MKIISNWRNATTFDIEADGLLDEATLFHVLSFCMANKAKGSIQGADHKRFKDFLNYHINNKIPVVVHNGICFDIPLCEKLLDIDLSELMVIDTLALSWYLNTDREMHGLGSFLEDYGIKKPDIENWDDLSYEEYKHRCEEDVKINVALWEDMQNRLIEMYTMTKHCIDSGKVSPKRMNPSEVVYLDRYINNSTVDEYIDRILTFLMFKMDCARLQEKTKWDVDLEYLEKTEKELGAILSEAKEVLEALMPPVPEYGTRTKPAGDPNKKDGTPKVQTVKWNEAVDNLTKFDSYGNPLSKIIDGVGDKVKVIKEYKAPNANSNTQLKNLFFSYGWKPQTFKYIKDKDAMELWVAGGFKKSEKPIPRMVPQISVDGEDGKELCPSILLLAEEVPDLLKYDRYTMVKHRHDTIKGFIRDVVNGKLMARVGGFTNTLRVKHREIVNLVGVDKPYGENIRGALISGEGNILLGSDLSSLEDRTKHHFMLAHDPDYVATMMADDYDPHILTAHSAGMVSDAELAGFKLGTLTGAIKEAVAKARKGGKTTNYASVYGGSPEAIARGGGIDLNLAKQLHEGYWKLNWSVKAIAEEQCVFEDSKRQKWLINPINGFCYSLRTEKDRFSTLCQGTGSFFFDIWVDNILESMYSKFKTKRLTGSFHDEIIICFKDLDKAKSIMKEIILSSIDKVNKQFLLRRDLGCDCQLGYRYSEIH